MGVRLYAGRWFRKEEVGQASETAIVNDVLAKRLWPGKNTIGRRICIDCTPENPGNWKRVVGVVSSVRHAALDGPAPENVYLSAGAFENAAFLVVRTDHPTGEIDKAIRRVIASIDPNQPVLLSASLRSLIDDSVADRRFIMTLLAITGCLALLMASAGIYGVTSYTTSRRTQEIGIRMALGATPGGVQTFIFRQGFLSAAGAFALGLGLTVMLMHLLRGVLVGLETGMTEDLWLASCLVLSAAAAACWIPARRATRIDPMCALRED